MNEAMIKLLEDVTVGMDATNQFLTATMDVDLNMFLTCICVMIEERCEIEGIDTVVAAGLLMDAMKAGE